MSNSPKHKARRMARAKNMKVLNRAVKPTPPGEKAGEKAPVDALTGMELAPGPCPNREDKAIMTVKYCGECKEWKGCPVWV